MLHISPIGIFSSIGGAYVPAGAIWLDGSADYLSWTPSGAPDDGTEWWLSVWVKDDGQYPDGAKAILGAGTSGTNYYTLDFGDTNQNLRSDLFESSSKILANSAAAYRDYSAWRHVAVHYDSDEATAADRYTVYDNGEAVTFSGSPTYPSSAATSLVLSAVAHRIGLIAYNTVKYWSGYMADFAMVDGGSSLTIADFGETDALGNWTPKDLSGITFGTNGFWLNFANSADLGNDVSGNNNDFTLNSITSANATNDNPADDAANDYGNYATLNPILQFGGTAAVRWTLSEGNLHSVASNSTGVYATQNIALGNGIYYEGTLTTKSSSGNDAIGFIDIHNATLAQHQYEDSPQPAFYYHASDAKVSANNAAESSYGSTWATDGKVVGVYISPTGKVWFSIGGTLQNSATESEVVNDTGTSHAFTISDGFTPFFGHRNSATVWDVNFGQKAWNTTPYSGYAGLSTVNTPAPTVTDPSAYMQTVLYTGTGATKSVTGVGFQPDFVWIKNRTGVAASHHLYDVHRGANAFLRSNTTDTENTASSDVLTSLDSDGFSLGADVSNQAVNKSGDTYVAWCLKAGGSGSSNTDGSITSTVSVADHGGFSIATYTGTGSNATVGHGLSSAPGFLTVKRRGSSGGWESWHDGLSGAGYFLRLDTTAAQSNATDFWQSTAPTASVFSVSTEADVNASSGTYVAYSFARTPGLIGIGSYTGNGSADGPYVVVDDGSGGSGFRPAWLLIKSYSQIEAWLLFDVKRDPDNPVYGFLAAHATDAEGTADIHLDITANGFKIRTTRNGVNTASQDYLYLAFAEYPFGGDGIAQARAR